MLSRRHIREKVMKALYAFFQSDNTSVPAGEKELFHSIDKVFEIYLYYLAIFPELRHFAEGHIEERKRKHLRSHEDLHPKLNFVGNRVIAAIADNRELKEACTRLKLSWNDQQDLIRKLYFSFRDDPEFRTYLEKGETGFEDDRQLLLYLLERFIFPSEAIGQVFEDRSIYWLDDIHLMQTGLVKTLKSLKEAAGSDFKLLPLLKDAVDDRKFASELFAKTILHSAKYEEEIARRAQNWEIDRVAKMDIILMKMALCELTEFPNIPVKVTLDEYIELSKDYSSPQSKIFINGILDKVVADFRRENRIQKAGRGLVE